MTSPQFVGVYDHPPPEGTPGLVAVPLYDWPLFGALQAHVRRDMVRATRARDRVIDWILSQG